VKEEVLIKWTREECENPHRRYAKIIKDAWVMMREWGYPFSRAMRESWEQATFQCRALGVEIR